MKLTYKIRLMGRRWLLRRLPPCDQIVPVISQSLDTDLSLHGQLVLKLHLFVCMRCTRYLQQLKFLRAAIRGKSAKLATEEPKDVSLTMEARERIKRALTSGQNN